MKKILTLLVLIAGFIAWSFYMFKTYQKIPIVSRISDCRRVLLGKEDLSEISHWETIVKQNPSYPDGWAKLAELWLENNRKDLAQYLADQAFELAPFREDLEELKQRLE